MFCILEDLTMHLFKRLKVNKETSTHKNPRWKEN